MRCLYCYRALKLKLSWENIIIGNQLNHLCDKCKFSFTELKPPLCTLCSKESKTKLCSDCSIWRDKYNQQDVLIKNYSVVKYTEFVQKYLTRWKYQGDYILKDGLLELIQPYINKQLKFIDETYTIIPIPLSDNRLAERAFNQAALLSQVFENVDESFLSRINTEKQSKKTKKERLNTINPFKMNKKIQGKVLLVDDIYTTGTTLRHAAILMLENGASEVRSFTFIRS